MAHLELPTIADGTDALDIAEEHRAELVICNARLDQSRNWFLQVRKNFGSKGE